VPVSPSSQPVNFAGIRIGPALVAPVSVSLTYNVGALTVNAGNSLGIFSKHARSPEKLRNRLH
jgi:hypothetical protein